MALTVDSSTKRKTTIELVEKFFLITFDNSYPTGGLALTPANLGFSDPATELVVLAHPAGGYTFQYDAANQKLKSFTSGGTETTNATNLSAITTFVRVLGRLPT